MGVTAKKWKRKLWRGTRRWSSRKNYFCKNQLSLIYYVLLSMIKKKSLIIKSPKTKVVSWDKVFPKAVFSLGKGSKAGIVVDRGAPQIFVFDTFAFLDILSRIDAILLEKLSVKDYYSKNINPSGWLIDEIESKLPVSEQHIKSLKNSISEAKKKGWIPFELIEKKFNLV